MVVKKIELSWIVVSDLEKALKYFTEVVGLKLNSHHPEFGWAELSAPEGGSLLGIAQANDREAIPAGQNAVMCMTVANIQQAKADMAKKGAIFVGDVMEVPGACKLQTFKDADGNMFQLVENLS